MKALTIWQPWATLIIAGAKPYEFRSWRPPITLVGMNIVVHAAARAIHISEVHQLVRLLEAGGRYAAHTCLKPDLALPLLRRWMNGEDHLMPLAAGLGTARVGVARLGTDIAREFGAIKVNDSDRDEHANWGWPMEEVKPFVSPFPMKGSQGLWNWPDAKDWAA
jgi:hypothetical protein